MKRMLFVPVLVCFLVLQHTPSPAQTCVTVLPDYGSQGDLYKGVDIYGTGTHFAQDVTGVQFENSGILVVEISVASPTHLVLRIDIADSAPLGRGNIAISTGSERVTCTDGFDVRPWVVLRAGNGAGLPGSMGQLATVSLANPAGPVRAVQMEICDAGNYLVPAAEAYELTGRTTGFTCAFYEQTNGCLSIVLSNLMPDVLIPPGDGQILKLYYDVSSQAPLGQSAAMTLSSVTVTNEENNGLEAILESGEFFFDADLDGDSQCDVQDNCPAVPNSSSIGTCVQTVSGFQIGTGATCIDNSTCGSGTCSMSQEDFNGNSIGDACECYADCNHDGTVNTSDLGIMKTEFFRTNCATVPCQADINGDNKVNTTDLGIMKVQFFRTGCPVP